MKANNGTTVYHTNKYYLGVNEVRKMFNLGRDKAYRLIKSMREELIKSGKLTPEYPEGKIPRPYFEERMMINKERRT